VQPFDSHETTAGPIWPACAYTYSGLPGSRGVASVTKSPEGLNPRPLPQGFRGYIKASGRASHGVSELARLCFRSVRHRSASAHLRGTLLVRRLVIFSRLAEALSPGSIFSSPWPRVFSALWSVLLLFRREYIISCAKCVV
jgi:hypothetical protein